MKILGFAGSLRFESYNKKALRVALQGAEKFGAQAEEVDLKALDIPLYNNDVELRLGIPKKVEELKKKIKEADGLLIATPEYNNSFSGVLKNTLDWISRPPDEPIVTAGKPTGLITASPGRFGGVRAAVSFRLMARSFKIILLNNEVQVANAGKVFEGNKIVDERVEKQLNDLGKEVVEWVDRLKI